MGLTRRSLRGVLLRAGLSVPAALASSPRERPLYRELEPAPARRRRARFRRERRPDRRGLRRPGLRRARLTEPNPVRFRASAVAESRRRTHDPPRDAPPTSRCRLLYRDRTVKFLGFTLRRIRVNGYGAGARFGPRFARRSPNRSIPGSTRTTVYRRADPAIGRCGTVQVPPSGGRVAALDRRRRQGLARREKHQESERRSACTVGERRLTARRTDLRSEMSSTLMPRCRPPRSASPRRRRQASSFDRIAVACAWRAMKSGMRRG